MFARLFCKHVCCTASYFLHILASRKTIWAYFTEFLGVLYVIRSWFINVLLKGTVRCKRLFYKSSRCMCKIFSFWWRCNICILWFLTAIFNNYLSRMKWKTPWFSKKHYLLEVDSMWNQVIFEFCQLRTLWVSVQFQSIANCHWWHLPTQQARLTCRAEVVVAVNRQNLMLVQHLEEVFVRMTKLCF